MRSLDRGLYFILSDNVRVVLDMGLILSIMAAFCGPRYFFLIFGTFASYIWWTFHASRQLLPLFQDSTRLQNRRENYQQEQLLLFDTIKHFGREDEARSRYGTICQGLQVANNKIQLGLSGMSHPQKLILGSGQMTMFAFSIFDIMASKMTVGTLLFNQELFEKLRYAILWLGFYMRELGQMSVDIESLYYILKTDS